MNAEREKEMIDALKGWNLEDALWDVSGAIRDNIVKPFDGAIILIQTRWHENDLAGKLLEDMEKGADQWDILDLPALSQNDTVALWPEKYNVERLLNIKRTVGERKFSALYQQNPTPEQGDYYQREWFKRYTPDELPATLNKYGTSDYAVTDKDGDFTEHTIWGLCAKDDTYLLDNWHDQTSADVWIESQLDLVVKHKPLMWFGEGGVIRRSIEPFLSKRMTERRVYVTMEWMNPIHSKVISARSFQARASQGKIYIPVGPMGDRCIEQLVKFPHGKHDDFPDTCALIGRALDETYRARLPINQDRVNTGRKYDFKKQPSSNWKTA